MKRAIPVFILSIYLFSATDVKELLKMNVVLEHFTEHHKEDNTCTFLHFLAMHYVTDDNNDKDNDRDMQLPFKSQVAINALGSFVSIVNPIISVAFPSPENKNIFLATDDSFVFEKFHVLVWHPPQFA